MQNSRFSGRWAIVKNMTDEQTHYNLVHYHNSYNMWLCHEGRGDTPEQALLDCGSPMVYSSKVKAQRDILRTHTGKDELDQIASICGLTLTQTRANGRWVYSLPVSIDELTLQQVRDCCTYVYEVEDITLE